LFSLHKLGGRRELVRNVILAAIIGVLAALLIKLTGDVAQWAAVGLGLYAVVTWGQVQKLRDRPLYALTFGDPTFLISLIGSALLACIGGAVSAWSAPYAMRTLGLSPVEVGLSMGLIFAGSAVCGVLAGGWMADRLKHRDRRAPIFVAMLSVVGEIPFLIGMLMASNTAMFLVAFAGFAFFSALWGGAFAALVQDLVLPRMRGSAASAFSLFSIVVASGIGPYWAGKVSTVTGSLQAGLYSMLLLVPVVLIIFIIVLPKVRIATPASRLARAVAAGEAN
jgi:MFS family permease